MDTDPACFNCKSELPNPFAPDKELANLVGIVFAVIGVFLGPILVVYGSSGQPMAISASTAIYAGLGSAVMGTFGYYFTSLIFRKKPEH